MHSRLGLVIVTYNSAETIKDCLDSLSTCPSDRLRVLVVDNCSSDDTLSVIGDTDFTGRLEVLQNHRNGGFAAGVNMGLEVLLKDRRLTHFWLLNPDCSAAPAALPSLLRFLDSGGGTGLTGGRVCFREPSGRIQTDGGTIDFRTGRTRGLHRGLAQADCPPPDPEQIAFVSGANLVASRRFVESVGPMPEEYFLYYEEVDWALRGGAFPIDYCPELVVDHQAGASIGTSAPGRSASGLSAYLLNRSRMAFLRAHGGGAGWAAHGFGLAKAAQALLRGEGRVALETLRGTLSLAPSRHVLSALTPARGQADYRVSVAGPPAGLSGKTATAFVSQTTR